MTVYTYPDPVGNLAAANADRRDRIMQFIRENPRTNIRGIRNELHRVQGGVPQHVVIADLVHLVSVGRLRLGVIPTDEY